MQNKMLVRILRWPSVFSCVRATVMAACSARLIVCLSGCDLTSRCVMVCVLGFTIPAPSVALPLTCEPSVYTKSLGFHVSDMGFGVQYCCSIVGVDLCRNVTVRRAAIDVDGV